MYGVGPWSVSGQEWVATDAARRTACRRCGWSVNRGVARFTPSMAERTRVSADLG